MFEDDNLELDDLQDLNDQEDMEEEFEDDIEDIDEVVQEEEKDESEDNEDVNKNLSKAVKAKNREIARLKAELEKQTKEIKEEPSPTYEYTPKEITQLSEFRYDGPSPEYINQKIKEYEAFLKGPSGHKLYEDDPNTYNSYRMELTEFKAELPRAVQATQYVKQIQKHIREAFISNIIANHPDMDRKEAIFIFDTADFNNDKPDTAIRKRVKEYEDMISKRLNKKSSKEKTKSKISNSLSRGSNYSVPTDSKKAKVMKAIAKLKQDPKKYRDLKEHAEFLKERNPKKYPKGFLSYVSLKADKILKGEI